jgi:hypothetical protein
MDIYKLAQILTREVVRSDIKSRLQELNFALKFVKGWGAIKHIVDKHGFSLQEKSQGLKHLLLLDNRPIVSRTGKKVYLVGDYNGVSISLL